ncbi:hypothetical protein, partial [Actinocorallia longicatena]|uniref:hypothetical protein n=1 Tax=Actinocorallia longicatena TaxID=111803 RepID=UPI0031D36AE6
GAPAAVRAAVRANGGASAPVRSVPEQRRPAEPARPPRPKGGMARQSDEGVPFRREVRTTRALPAGLKQDFKEALDRSNGSVPAALAEMKSAGKDAPSRGYAYALQKEWHAEQASTT